MTRIAKPRLDVGDLDLVLAIAAAGSTSRAATTLHRTQSAVSRGLLLAEEKLGARLFERTSRGLTPTPTGERLVAGAAALLAQWTELERAALQPGPAPTRVRLVCECYTAYRWLPSTLAKLRAQVPDLEVSLALEHTQAPVPALLDGTVDVALLTTSPVRGKLLEQPLFADEIVFVLGATHPLATRASLSARDLRETTLLSPMQLPPAAAQWFAARVFGKRPPRLNVIRLPLTEAIMDVARANMGVAIVSEWIADGYLGAGDLVAKRLRGAPLRRAWRIAFRREQEGAALFLAGALTGAPPRMMATRR